MGAYASCCKPKENDDTDDSAAYDAWMGDSSWLSKVNDVVTSDLVAVDVTPCQILPKLWLGDNSSAQDKENLRRLNITAVINVAAENNSRFVDDEHCVRYNIITHDEDDYPLLENHFQEVQKIIDLEIFNRSVLLHCGAGVNRSGALMVAYLMVHQQMGLLDAIRHCYAARGILLTNRGFQKQLVNFARSNNLLK